MSQFFGDRANKKDRNVDSEFAASCADAALVQDGQLHSVLPDRGKERKREGERERTDKNLCSAEGELSFRNKEPRGTTKEERWGKRGEKKKPSKQQQNTTGSPEQTLGERQHSTVQYLSIYLCFYLLMDGWMDGSIEVGMT